MAQWDILIIGGGASGLGAAVDAASRGYRTLLLEQGDFAQETSSKSTKLIHGGLRYLRQGQFSFVRHSLRERSLLLQNAPHLVYPRSFLLPAVNWFELGLFITGIKLYDLLSGRAQIGRSRCVSKKELRQLAPSLTRYRGGITFNDGQFDDARLALTLAQTANDHEGIVINYMQVEQLVKERGKVSGVIARDLETDQAHLFRSKIVINATGAFVDTMRALDEQTAPQSVLLSQGAHLVLNRSFFPGEHALLVPHTSDGRILFIIPWYNCLLIGTTETKIATPSLQPTPLPQEIDYLLTHANPYLLHKASLGDIQSSFAGIRPLVKPEREKGSSARLSRGSHLDVSSSGLLSVTGGKWTTYRQMGEETIDLAATIADLPYRPSATAQLRLHGAAHTITERDEYHFYGSERNAVEQLAQENPNWKEKMHPEIPCRGIDVIWAVRNEMARTIEDILARRNRSLFFHAKASLHIAPRVASLMAKELARDPAWEAQQITLFQKRARSYQQAFS